MNFIKKSLVRGTKFEVKASKEVKALLLPISDLFIGPWGLTNSFCSLVELVKELLQEFCQIQNPKAIAIEI